MLAAYTDGVYPSPIKTPECPTLPPELLSQIFRHYLQLNTPYDPEERQSSEQRCFTEHLLLVCRSWYDAATADSSLWREIILDSEIARVSPYTSLYSYIRARSIRSRTHLLHVSINNDPGRVGRLMYLKAYYHLVTTMARWERLFYYLKYWDHHSCITIDHLAAPTPHLREMVIRSPHCAVVDISDILPETPNLQFLEISVQGTGPLTTSFFKSITDAPIRSYDDEAWMNALSKFKTVHTLILQPPHVVNFWKMVVKPVPIELPKVQTLVLVGPSSMLYERLEYIKFPALQTLEVDLRLSYVEKRWSKMDGTMGEQLKRCWSTGLRKLVLKGVWFDRWECIVDILQDAKGRVEELVCIDVQCTLGHGEGQEVHIDLSTILMQQGAICPALALSILDGLFKEHGIGGFM
jgi:hypothetical protein